MPYTKLTQPAFLVKAGYFLLLLFHISGFIGICFSPHSAWFLAHTPLNLLVAAACVGVFVPYRSPSFWAFTAITAVVGFWVEYVGINTGFPFGQYNYVGSIMGAQYKAVPLMLAIVWWLQVYCYGVVAQTLVYKGVGAAQTTKQGIVRAAVAAAMMVTTDYPMELLANRAHLWHWQNGTAPWQNYAGWFGYGFLLQGLFVFLPFGKQNPMAAVYCVVTTAFFAALHFFW